MIDTLTPNERSERMSRVKGKNTKPEMIVRRLVWSMGYRYRLHDKKLPGKPDLVFRRLYKVVFVHGCYWHRHEGCKLARLPKSRREFWIPKLEANKVRDVENIKKLKELGWGVLVVWECELRNPEQVKRKIKEFLGSETKK